MRHYAFLIALLLPIACAPQRGVAESGSAAGTRSCIDLSQVTGQRVERGQIIYNLSNGESVSNDLGGRCAPLQRATGGEIIQTETNGSQLCRGDGVRVYDPVTVGAGGPGAVLRCQAAAFGSVPAG